MFKIFFYLEKIGIENQGSDAIYPSLPYIRGQLVPALTLSNTGKGDEGWLSTFTYTNAVPQRPDFNMGEWLEFENKIRSYARNDCIPNRGKLYLLTGTSFVHSEPDWPIWPRDPKRQPWLANIKDNYLIPDSPPIAIPVSLWTAGCCIDSKNGTVTGNFAVIGNNEEDPQLMHTRQISVEQLQSILKQDVKANENSNRVKLFPAIRDCTKESKQITLPWAWRAAIGLYVGGVGRDMHLSSETFCYYTWLLPVPQGANIPQNWTVNCDERSRAIRNENSNLKKCEGCQKDFVWLYVTSYIIGQSWKEIKKREGKEHIKAGITLYIF